MSFPWEFVDYLISAFGLNECEACDLSELANVVENTGIDRQDLISLLWARADKLSRHGSDMQMIWDRMKEKRV